MQILLFNWWGSHWGQRGPGTARGHSECGGGRVSGEAILGEAGGGARCPRPMQDARRVSESLRAPRPRCALSPSREAVPPASLAGWVPPHHPLGFRCPMGGRRGWRACGGQEACGREAWPWTEPHPLLGWPPAGYSLTLGSPPPFPRPAFYPLPPPALLSPEAGAGCWAGPGIVENPIYPSLPWCLAGLVHRCGFSGPGGLGERRASHQGQRISPPRCLLGPPLVAG